MPLTAKQILASLYRVPPSKDGTDRFDRAVDVRVTGMKRGVSKSTGFTRFLCKTRTPEHRNGRRVIDTYVTTVDYFPNGKYVQLSCSCPDFTFMWEYNLMKKKAAVVRYSNGEPPTKRIPIGMCKHLIRSFDVLHRSGQVDGNFELIPK